MREVCIYRAYDGTEFFDRDVCIVYESEHLKYLKEIDRKYSFFDADMNLIMAPTDSDDIEDWVGRHIETRYDCVTLVRYHNLSEDACRLLRYDVFDYAILNKDFNYEVGWFNYDEHDGKWVKVGEQPTLIFC